MSNGCRANSAPAGGSLRLASRRLATVAALLAAAAAAPAAAQFRTTVNVDLITVEVVVTDPTGRFVRGLHPADFRVLEDEAEQAITHFEEVGAAATGDGSPAPATVGRDLLVFIDLYTSGPIDSAHVMRLLRTELPHLAAGGTRIAIATCDGTLRVHTLPTLDPDRIRRALHEAATAIPRPLEPDAQTMHQFVTLIAERNGWIEDAFEAAMRAMPRTRARRVALVVTPGRNLRSELAMRGPFCTTAQCLSQKASWLESYGAMLGMGLLSRSSLVATELGYTLFVVDPRALSTVDVGVPAEYGLRSAIVMELIGGQLSLEASERRWSLQAAAEATGGAARPHGDIAGAIADITKRTTAYYSLAYETEHPGDGRFHDIRVDIPSRPDLTLSFRKRYVDRPDDERRAAGVLSDLLAGTARQQLGAGVTIGEVKRRTVFRGGFTRIARVPVTVLVPIADVTLLPDGETARGSVLLVAYATERWYQRSAVMKRQVPIAVPVAELAQARLSFWKYTFELEVESSSPSLHVGVADAVSGVSTTVALPLSAREKQYAAGAS